MIVRKPAYYSEFRCLAGDCPDSCCHQWTVQIDEESRERYRNLDGELGEALRGALTEEDGDTVLRNTPDGRCPMWRRDGLCRIQAELGESALSLVCREFPRLTHDYGTFTEKGLELSCPEAARLILEADDSWVTEQTPNAGEEPDWEDADMELLLRTRRELCAMLQNPRFSVQEALAAALFYGYHVQQILDGEEETPFSPEDALKTGREMAQQGDMAGILAFFQDLEILTPQWKKRLETPLVAPWDGSLRRIARYFVQRYYLQAVSDLDLVCRVKFAVISCLVIHGLGGDLRETAQLYSKEIENDWENMEAVLDGCYREPALSDRNLLSCLLGRQDVENRNRTK